MQALTTVIWRTFAILALTTVTLQADVLITTNGERFVGTLVEERPDAVVFESESVGRLTLPRERIQEIQRAATTQLPNCRQHHPPPSPTPTGTRRPWARMDTTGCS